MSKSSDSTRGGATLAGLILGGLVVVFQLVTLGGEMPAYRPENRLDVPTPLTETQHNGLLAAGVTAALALITLSSWLARRSLLLRALVVAAWTALLLLVGIETAVRVFWTVTR